MLTEGAMCKNFVLDIQKLFINNRRWSNNIIVSIGVMSKMYLQSSKPADQQSTQRFFYLKSWQSDNERHQHFSCEVWKGIIQNVYIIMYI